MDINRAELKGRMASDLYKHKNDKNGLWLAFTVATNELVPSADIEKNKQSPTYTQVAVFNPYLVERILKCGARQGAHVWVVGKLFVKHEVKNGVNVNYTSVVASEVEILRRGRNPLEEKPLPKEDEEEQPF